MVMKANGYAVWENLQRELDTRFKATGHHPSTCSASLFEEASRLSLP
jgi:hypothetical protein